MAQPDLEIIGLLQGRLAAMAPQPAGGIAWPNRSFTPLTGQPWVRVTRGAWQEEVITGLSDGRPQLRLSGLELIDCFAPEGRGPEECARLAAQVRGWLHAGLALQGAATLVYVERCTPEQPRQGAGSEEDPTGYLIPLTLSWRAYYDAG